MLNYVGYEIPFLIACVFASFTTLVTRRLAPATQRSPARIAKDQRRAEAAAQAQQATPPVAREVVD